MAVLLNWYLLSVACELIDLRNDHDSIHRMNATALYHSQSDGLDRVVIFRPFSNLNPDATIHCPWRLFGLHRIQCREHSL
jgi:hypothetical protein